MKPIDRARPWLLGMALLIACVPAGAAGWIKLLSKTAAEKFDDEDLKMFLEAARDALNAEGTKPVAWSNPKNGTGGSVVVIGDSTRNGLNCRRIRFANYAPGYPNPPKTSTTWTACKTADGRWKLAEAN